MCGCGVGLFLVVGMWVRVVVVIVAEVQRMRRRGMGKVIVSQERGSLVHLVQCVGINEKKGGAIQSTRTDE